jgi:hypothetical protein
MKIELTENQYHQTAKPITYQKPSPRPKMAIAAMVLAIVSAIMVIIAGTFVWWWMSIDIHSISSEAEGSGEILVDYTLEEAKIVAVLNGTGGNVNEERDIGLNNGCKDVGDITGHLLMGSFIMMIIVVIMMGLIIGASRTIEMAGFMKKFKNLAVMFAFVALMLVLIAPIYYLFAWPNAIEAEDEESGFSRGIYDGTFGGLGSCTETEEYDSSEVVVIYDFSWGPGIGWIYAFICLVPMSLTMLLAELGGERALKSVQLVRPMPPYMEGNGSTSPKSPSPQHSQQHRQSTQPLPPPPQQLKQRQLPPPPPP